MSKAEKASGAQAKKVQALTAKDVGLDGIKKKKLATGFSTWVRVLMQNWRQGTVGCQGRSDVSRTNKKPFKQKGTGRARAGTARSPLWRGGGVTFGPQERVRKLSVPQKVKKAVLRNAIIDQIDKKKITVADWIVPLEKPSTSQAYNLLKTMKLECEKVVLFLPWSDTLTRASFNNIPMVNIVFFDHPDIVNIVGGTKTLVLKKDLEQFKAMVAKWI